ncbi:MAG TPA: hypothetical protein VLL05_01925, partial [Terriglobales bacterium]|nr:hypothetical protein [Terriglobales bacterium]
MTLRNRLYLAFGAVLFMVLVMFAVNWRAVTREHEAKKAAASSLELRDATDQVKFHMMQNRLYLSNYLLSGDTREVDKMNDGIRLLNNELDKTQGLAASEQEKTALEKAPSCRRPPRAPGRCPGRPRPPRAAARRAFRRRRG